MTTLALNFKQAALTLLVLGLVLLSSVATNASSDPDVPPLKWSPDGSYIARVVGTTIEVRDATSTQVLHELKGHTDFIPMVAWSPDSTRLASPSFDQTVRVWRISDGALLHTLTGHNDAITAVAWTPNGDRLISFGYDSEPSVFHWDANTGALLSKQPGGLMIDAQFGPKGQPLALTNTTFIIVVDIVDDFTFEFIGESPYTRCCVNQMYYIEWNPDGTMFATGSVNGLVTLWDASNAQILHQFVANPHHAPDHRDVDDVALSWVRAVTFSGDGQTVLAVSGDGTVRAWDTASGTLLEEAHVPPLMNAAWSPDGTRLAYEDRQGAMQFVTSPINVTPTPTATPTVTETPTTTPTPTALLLPPAISPLRRQT